MIGISCRRIFSLSKNSFLKCNFRININSEHKLLQREFIKSIHTTNTVTAKIFVDTENNYAHDILEANGNYYLVKNIENNICDVTDKEVEIICQSKQWMDEISENLLAAFEKLSHYCNQRDIPISDDRFDSFVDAMMAKCSKFSDEQLLKTLHFLSHFPPTASPNTKNFVELWSALDDACVERIQEWQTDKLLLVCDHWFALNLAKICKFTFQTTKRLGRKLKNLSPSELVQTMFYVNLCRKPLIEMFNFEVNFAKSVDNLSLDEIAVMSMGFFKTQTPIRNPELLDKIFIRLIDEISTVKDISLVNIIKTLRYSSKLQQIGQMENFFTAVTPEVRRLSLLSCLHIALTGTDVQYCHQKCLEEIVNRFIQNIKEARLKDFERITHVMGLFNFEMENNDQRNLCELILKEIPNRIDEIVKYPRCLSACLHYLTLCGYHSEDLIDGVLDPKYYDIAYGKNYIAGREIFCLDSFTRINLKTSYNGNQLADKIRRSFAKLLTNYIPSKDQKYKLSASDKILLEIKDSCDDLFNNMTEIAHVLPHFERPDIIIAYDKTKGKPIDVRENCLPHYSGIILSKEQLCKNQTNSDNIKIFTIVVGGWNLFVRDTNKLTGSLKLKLKQLEMIGHIPILIPWYDWRKLTTQERPIYLQSILKHSL